MADSVDPQTPIYLRNVFRLKRRAWDRKEDVNKDYGQMFLKGKEEFVKYTSKMGWELVAAFGEWPLFKDGVLIEPGCEMVQIWRLPKWDTLYNTMIALSETAWYRSLGESLASEDHELLIKAGVREPTATIKWLTDSEPGYTYFYEVVRPNENCHHRYLRDVYWFDAWMSGGPGWELVWWGSQVTAQPAELALLWRFDIPEAWDRRVFRKSFPTSLRMADIAT
jgi:hypothetical protein